MTDKERAASGKVRLQTEETAAFGIDRDTTASNRTGGTAHAF
jgi:hypothetical protein